MMPVQLKDSPSESTIGLALEWVRWSTHQFVLMEVVKEDNEDLQEVESMVVSVHVRPRHHEGTM